MIFHTADMHGRLSAKRAAKLRETLSADPDALYFDSGDAVRHGNLDIRPWDRTLARLRQIGCAAMAVGNREFHPWPTTSRWKARDAGFPLLAANIRLEGEPLTWIQPSTAIMTASGLRVGVFGLTLPIVKAGTWHERLSRFRFEEPVEAARRTAAELRAQCDVVIALTHIGLSADRRIAGEVEGIDLILGGHSHSTTDPPERIVGTTICHSGECARYVTRLEVSVAGPGDVVVRRQAVNLC